MLHVEKSGSTLPLVMMALIVMVLSTAVFPAAGLPLNLRGTQLAPALGHQIWHRRVPAEAHLPVRYQHPSVQIIKASETAAEDEEHGDASELHQQDQQGHQEDVNKSPSDPENQQHDSEEHGPDDYPQQRPEENLFQDMQNMFGDLYLAPNIRLSDLAVKDDLQNDDENTVADDDTSENVADEKALTVGDVDGIRAEEFGSIRVDDDVPVPAVEFGKLLDDSTARVNYGNRGGHIAGQFGEFKDGPAVDGSKGVNNGFEGENCDVNAVWHSRHATGEKLGATNGGHEMKADRSKIPRKTDGQERTGDDQYTRVNGKRQLVYSRPLKGRNHFANEETNDDFEGYSSTLEKNSAETIAMKFAARLRALRRDAAVQHNARVLLAMARQEMIESNARSLSPMGRKMADVGLSQTEEDEDKEINPTEMGRRIDEVGLSRIDNQPEMGQMRNRMDDREIDLGKRLAASRRLWIRRNGQLRRTWGRSQKVFRWGK